MINRLVLGTAQFGLPYGIASEAGQVNRAEAAAIVEQAWRRGLNTLDTAIAYGESEQRLGEIGVGQWQIISKLPAVPDSCTDVIGWVHKSVLGSLERLGVPQLRGLLLHRPHQLLDPQGEKLYRALVAIKDQGTVEKIGISIYGPDELEALLPRYQFDLVQAPFNIIDRRLLSSGWLTWLNRASVEVHVRSVFLQGLLLMEAGKRPAALNRWEPLWQQWHRWLDKEALSPLQACLGYALAQPGIDHVVVGVDSRAQLEEILSTAETRAVEPPRTLVSDAPDLVNPSQWSAL